VYTANQGSGSVSVFTVDAATGALAAVAGSPFPAGSGARAIAID
jgi:6-phosphogluconolactonase (cycloisomerase 2 family)